MRPGLTAGALGPSIVSLINSKFLTETLWTLQAGESVPLQQEHRAALHAVHLFDAAAHVPVRTYDVDATAAELNKASLWETCTGRVAGLFATLPLTDVVTNVERGLRNSTVHSRPGAVENFDASRDSAEDRVHSMELLVEALLERARETTPHFWTHAHRYVASDSVWCEGANRNFTEPPVTTTQTRLEEHALRPEPVLAPGPEELMYPADVLRTCACGWTRADGLCYVPDGVCAAGKLALADSEVRVADGRLLRETWAALCESGAYALAEVLQVLQVLQGVYTDGSQMLPSDALRNCSARQLSIAWGLLAPAELEDWMAGARGNWSADAQHLATAGPGGLRIAMLSLAAPETMQEYVRAFELGERLAGTFNARHGHTIAQPVCEGTLREHLREDLRLYFPDVFVPMAHAVQIAPPVEYCARWAIEHAMSYVLRSVALTETALLEGVLERQVAATLVWRDRCAAQMHEVGLCALRGVYDIVPNATDVPSSARPAAGCAFAGAAHTVSGCARLYYTSGCLLYCDGAFYDPCLCSGNGGPGECAPRPFAPANCVAGRVVDGRQLLDAADEVLLTSSLSLPADIQPAEAANDTHWTALRAVLAQAHAVSKLGDVDFDSIFARSAAELLARADDEGTPSGYCDDLFDYWPDAQHPVGYHPSTACAANASNTRGFDAWMSRNATGHDRVAARPCAHAQHDARVAGLRRCAPRVRRPRVRSAWASPQPVLHAEPLGRTGAGRRRRARAGGRAHCRRDAGARCALVCGHGHDAAWTGALGGQPHAALRRTRARVGAVVPSAKRERGGHGRGEGSPRHAMAALATGGGGARRAGRARGALPRQRGRPAGRLQTPAAQALPHGQRVPRAQVPAQLPGGREHVPRRLHATGHLLPARALRVRLSRRGLGRGRISAQGSDGSRNYLPSTTDVHFCSACGKGRRRRQLSESRASGDGSRLAGIPSRE